MFCSPYAWSHFQNRQSPGSLDTDTISLPPHRSTRPLRRGTRQAFFASAKEEDWQALSYRKLMQHVQVQIVARPSRHPLHLAFGSTARLDPSKRDTERGGCVERVGFDKEVRPRLQLQPKCLLLSCHRTVSDRNKGQPDQER